MFTKEKTIIGMLHCPIIPEDSNSKLYLQKITDKVLYDLELLMHGGIDAVLFENFSNKKPRNGNYDVPVYPIKGEDKGKYMIENFRFLAERVAKNINPGVLWGIHLLWNYAAESLEIAADLNASFVRNQVFIDDRVALDGRKILATYEEVEKTLARLKKNIRILGDVETKETSTPVYDVRTFEEKIKDALELNILYGIITTGTETGKAPGKKEVEDFAKMVKSFSPDVKMGVGSGVTLRSLREGLLDAVDFAIVGSYFKKPDYAELRINEATREMDEYAVKAGFNRSRGSIVLKNVENFMQEVRKLYK